MEYSELVEVRDYVMVGWLKDFLVSNNGMLIFKVWVCASNVEEVKKKVLEEVHATPYPLHPGTTKMYHDLKPYFWWYGMKREVVDYGLSVKPASKLKLNTRGQQGYCNL